jgi:hypothetical protein
VLLLHSAGEFRIAVESCCYGAFAAALSFKRASQLRLTMINALST